ncbi:TPA: 1-deoxy-D-xylulose-5-phosphate reductoisomerase [Candidatus Avigastranaerophilus faecigallinarum]|nr:1-deoxy-D-xylulose-5-phosphate reductoisomerase [Candidatus Avigastranaerophilus faecigallinarum]
MRKRIAILGSTGSIGTQALEVTEKLSEKFEIIALSAGNNIQLLKEQIKKYTPKYVSIKNETAKIELEKEFPNIKILYGTEGLIELATLNEIDTLLVAVSGKIGLKPTIEAIKKKKNIALANKETLVMAGDIVMKLAKENNVQILPVDSEHSAIFQCINGGKNVKKLIITASGGPFRTSDKEELQTANLDKALAHPRWNMGKKITVDSATLMNKGLEVIEAHHLFNFDYEDIKVVIHPQSYVHSAVEFVDGSIIAQIGIPSMHIPIQYALTYPDRVEGIETESFDFIKAAKLEFYEPDYEKFPSLSLAFKAGKLGGTYPVCMNAANEEAVFAFLDKKIKYLDIYKITKSIFDDYKSIDNPTLDQILEEDEKVRELTKKIIKKYEENQ